MDHLFQINIMSLNCKIYNGFSKMLVVPAVTGELAILANHAPLLSLLKPGKIKIFKNDSDFEEITIDNKAILQVNNNVVTVLI